MISVRNAGIAEQMSSISTFEKFLSIRTPTKINAGAVANDGTIYATGAKNKHAT